MNKKLLRGITLGLLFVMMITVFSSAAPLIVMSQSSETPAQSMDGTKDEGVFRVGMEAGYAPFNWTQNDDSNGGIKINDAKEYAGGYDVEIAKIIADELGLKLEIEKIEWDGLVMALTSGKIDAIIAGMSPTEERRKSIDFTDVYYQSNLVMVVNSKGEYADATSIQDFKGAKITGQLNTFHYDVIEQIEGVNQETAMDNFPAMRVALESGVIDGYVTERPEGISASDANSNFTMVEFEDGFVTNPEDTAIAVGVRKDSELTQKINDVLAGISLEEQNDIMDRVIKEQPAAKEKSVIGSIIKDNWQRFLRGAGVTLYISMIGTIIGTIIGLLVGVIRTVPVPEKGFLRGLLKFINGLLSVYIEIFRGTPMIVQSMVIFYGAATINIDLNKIFAAILIVSINTGAYMSEIVRGGIVSIDKGQFEAAQALGMKHLKTMRHIILPQVIRNILPATGNEFVINIKDTSVLNVISVTELFFQTKSIAGANFKYFQTFFVACVLYFIMTFTVTRILRFIEKKMDGPSNYTMAGNQMQVKIPEIKSNQEA
ncbi:MAG TPA: ABC transporter permease subunit [Candidatus Merdenecus merdavium]|nr:ABC transporter permease subunit [Candidatus Merdenecus merdavium]